MTRYDGWFLAGVVGRDLAVIAVRRWEDRTLRWSALKFLARHRGAPCALADLQRGNLWERSDFANGPYSAKAIELRVAAPNPGIPQFLARRIVFSEVGTNHSGGRQLGAGMAGLPVAYYGCWRGLLLRSRRCGDLDHFFGLRWLSMRIRSPMDGCRCMCRCGGRSRFSISVSGSSCCPCLRYRRDCWSRSLHDGYAAGSGLDVMRTVVAHRIDRLRQLRVRLERPAVLPGRGGEKLGDAARPGYFGRTADKASAAGFAVADGPRRACRHHGAPRDSSAPGG